MNSISYIHTLSVGMGDSCTEVAADKTLFTCRWSIVIKPDIVVPLVHDVEDTVNDIERKLLVEVLEVSAHPHCLSMAAKSVSINEVVVKTTPLGHTCCIHAVSYLTVHLCSEQIRGESSVVLLKEYIKRPGWIVEYAWLVDFRQLTSLPRYA